MKEWFPAEIAAQKINFIQPLITGPLHMVQVDQFGYARKPGIGAAGQQGIALLEYRTEIYGGKLAAAIHTGDPQ